MTVTRRYGPALASTTSIHAVGNSGSTLTLNAAAAAGSTKTITLTANCTFTFSGASVGSVATLELILTQDGTGSRLVTWPNTVRWPNGEAPTLSTAAGAIDHFVFTSVTGGATWFGAVIALNYA